MGCRGERPPREARIGAYPLGRRVLWLDPAALLAGDLSKLLAAIDRGCSTEPHRQFAARLAAAATGGSAG